MRGHVNFGALELVKAEALFRTDRMVRDCCFRRDCTVRMGAARSVSKLGKCEQPAFGGRVLTNSPAVERRYTRAKILGELY